MAPTRPRGVLTRAQAAALTPAQLRAKVLAGWLAPIAGADPAADAIDEVRSSVAELRSAIDEMRTRDGGDALDQEKVETIVTELLERQKAATPEQNKRHGYVPDDVDEEQLQRTLGRSRRERLTQIQMRSADRVAPLIGRSAEDIRSFQTRCDELVLLDAMLKDVDVRDTDYFQEEFLPSVRAMDTATSAEGAEWKPVELSSTFIERVNLELKVAALFGVIPMPTQPYDLPAAPLSRVRTGTHAEQTADTGQTKFKVLTPGTRKITLDAKKFAGRVLVSKESEEDLIVPILGWVEGELIEYVAADIEDALINGDITGTHQDSDTTASDDPRKVWKGLRKAALAGTADHDAANVDLTVALLNKNRVGMGKFGVNPGQLAHIVTINDYIKLLNDANILTIDKYGSQATILTGELAKAGGVPVVVSEYARADLNASGVYDATTTNRGMAMTVNRKGWLRGFRRQITVQRLVELYAESDQDAVIASTRQAFTELYATTNTVGGAFNTKSV